MMLFLQCVEALLNPLKLNDPVETKTMTDKFAAVCILQVRPPNQGWHHTPITRFMFSVDIIIIVDLWAIRLRTAISRIENFLCGQGYLDNMNRALRHADKCEE